MLKRLSVENYALIDKLDIAFAPGLNIITGETGAGKSILLGALGLILGNRGDVAAIRDAQRNCVIEAEFDLSGYRLEGLFASFDIDYDQQCMIRRVITPAGKSRAYVNDLPVQLAALRAIGERLIDIHSQHQTLLLGESRFQTALLDSVAAHAQLLEQYGSVYDELNRTQRERDVVQRLAADSGRGVAVGERGDGMARAGVGDEIAADPETLLGIGGLRQPAPQRTDAALYFGCVGSRFPQARVEAVEQLLSRQAAVERRGAFCRRAADRYD